MSAAYGETDRDESLATIHAPLEAGVTLLDTGDVHGMGHNELLISVRAVADAIGVTVAQAADTPVSRRPRQHRSLGRSAVR